MTETVPTFPRIEAAIAADHTGAVAINGVSQAVSGADDQAVRAEIIALVTATATEFNRPVRLTTRDALGEQVLAVYPDGHVEALTGLTEPPAFSSAAFISAASILQPSVPITATQPSLNVVPAPAHAAARPTLDDFLQSRPAAPVGPATTGWQGSV